LHVGNVRSQRFVRRIVARLQRLQPAAVFIVGDMFDGAKVDVAAAVRPWTGLRTPAGIFFVSGNHDEFSERAPYFEALERTGVRVLHNERVDVDGMQIIGVHDGESNDPGLFRQILDRAGIDRSRASILLSHRPVKLEIPEQAGVSLQLSGHTHAGQFWPWSLVVSKIYGRFAYGLSRHGNLQIFTSSGVGTWGPPLRIGTRSEVVVLHLRAQKEV
jgi:predicted MPP superfamily phosphohydrolase